MSTKTVKSYSILKQAGPILRLWDGPRLTRNEALLTVRKRRNDYPKEKWFVYRTDWYYDRGVCDHKKGQTA